MNARHWSFVLSWARLGINAALFLIATRFLTLAEIGLFATAFAPVRMSQGLHKAGIADAVVVLGKTPMRLDALFVLAAGSGLVLSLGFGFIGAVFSPYLLALAAVPLLNGLCAVSEGILRKRLHLRALALRTIAAQGVAAALALAMLAQGWGAWALVVFALGNATLTCALSICIASWRPKTWPSVGYLRLMADKTKPFAGRVLLNSTQMPLAQLAVGLALGPAAAGAFQIATRMLELIDALALSPLRYIALPQLTAHSGSSFAQTLAAHLRMTALLSAWLWGGTIAATPTILALAVGPGHAETATPVLRALAGFGLLSALVMPLTQALLARGHTQLVLLRAAVLLGAGAVFMLPALTLSATVTATALTLAAALTTAWYVARALHALNLTINDLDPLTQPLTAGTAMCITLLLMPLPLIAQIAFGTALYASILSLLRHPNWKTA